MYGIIFLVISMVAFGGLYMYIKKSDNGNKDDKNNRKELMNELYNKAPKDRKTKNKKTSEAQLEVDKNNTNEDNTDAEESQDNIDDEDEEYEEFTYDSYKSDEEYLRIAKLMKNIYFTIVAVVIMVLGILYIMLFKLS